MNLSNNDMLKNIVNTLKEKNVEVNFIQSEKDGIEIGELKNGRITLNTNSRDKLGIIFTIAHLFGHYNQFRNYSKYKHLIEAVEKPAPLILSKDFKEQFWEYEKEAFGIGKTLMIESFGVTDEIDQKYQSFMVTDFDHFWHFITTGENEGIQKFNEQLEMNYVNHPKFEKQIEPIPYAEFPINETNIAQVTIY